MKKNNSNKNKKNLPLEYLPLHVDKIYSKHPENCRLIIGLHYDRFCPLFSGKSVKSMQGVIFQV